MDLWTKKRNKMPWNVCHLPYCFNECAIWVGVSSVPGTRMSDGDGDGGRKMPTTYDLSPSSPPALRDASGWLSWLKSASSQHAIVSLKQHMSRKHLLLQLCVCKQYKCCLLGSFPKRALPPPLSVWHFVFVALSHMCGKEKKNSHSTRLPHLPEWQQYLQHNTLSTPTTPLRRVQVQNG